MYTPPPSTTKKHRRVSTLNPSTFASAAKFAKDSQRGKQLLDGGKKAECVDVFKQLSKTRKDRQKRETTIAFRYLLSFFCVCAVLSVLYFNYLMVRHHLQVLFLALLSALFLASLRDTVYKKLIHYDDFLRPKKLKCIIAISIACTLLFSLRSVISTTLGIIFIASAISLWRIDRDTIAAFLCVALCALVIGIPAFFLVRTCADESQELADIVLNFDKRHLEKLASVISASPSTIWVREQALRLFNTSVPEISAEQLQGSLQSMTRLYESQSSVVFSHAMNILSSFGSFLSSFGIYLMMLVFFLQSKTAILAYLKDLMPFSRNEQAQISASMHKSVSRIVYSSICVGTVHFFTMLISLWLVDSPVVFLPAMASGFLSMLPLLSSWIVWVPIVIVLCLIDRLGTAVLFALVQLVIGLVVDNILLAILPGNAYYVGLCLIGGLYSFGPIGVLFAPLLAGLTVTILDILKEYVKTEDEPIPKPQMEYGAFAPPQSLHVASAGDRQQYPSTAMPAPSALRLKRSTISRPRRGVSIKNLRQSILDGSEVMTPTQAPRRMASCADVLSPN